MLAGKFYAALAEPMDEIILLNENYADQGLRAGYVGTVMENLIEKHGVVIADFSNPVTGDYIRPVAYIKKEDFRVLSNAESDNQLAKAFKDLFKK